MFAIIIAVMLLILLSWIYIFFTTLNFGTLFKKVLGIQNCNPITHHFLGLLLYTLLCSLVAFFMRLNIEFYLFAFIVNVFIVFKFRNSTRLHFNSFFKTFYNLKTSYRVLYVFILIIVLAQSSTKPYLLDNESYYIQTIKWINEYGYVKGLVNLHPFLGQNSSWHALQAGFNFSFITPIFNDINGYLFMLASLLYLEKLNNYEKGKNIQNFYLGLTLIFSVFLMQFINAPSPDLIIFLVTPYMLFLFLKKRHTISINDFKIILSLVLFLCFVKVTMAILIVLVIILFVQNFTVLKGSLASYIAISSAMLILFLCKNAIISGYLFYPIDLLDFLNFEWKQPKALLNFYKRGTFLDGMNNVDTSHLNFFETFKYWLTIPKLDGLFNSLYALLLIIFPWFVFKKNKPSGLFIIYTLSILQLMLLWNNSPQYRFFFVFIMFLSVQIFISIFKNKTIGFYLVCIAVIASTFPIFFNINLKHFTNNVLAMDSSRFNIKNIIVPEGVSKTTTACTKESINGFEFYSPNSDMFIWGTGDGNLPCVNKKQVHYIKKYYHYMPALRTKNLKDGFLSVPTENETIKTNF